ncbi:MAG: glutamate--tRNA ligase family protein, partial [Acidobacteriota bacterium]|nr:glutamate--tRNA ligase family protein [Acidobacteriota bacterium]
MITRFAPAPTGYLHLGHVVNALHVWQAADDRDGRVLLRIEDHDRQRARPEYEAAILEDLAWLGFRHDGPIVRQSEREAIYRKAIQPLIDRELVYGCSCTRAELAAGVGSRESGVEVPYRNTCRDRDIPLTDDVGWRLRIDPGTESFFDEINGPQVQEPSAQCGDLLLRDRLGNWTYQFAVTVDDHVQQVTDVIRGIDLLASTGRQIRLARLLGRDK